MTPELLLSNYLKNTRKQISSEPIIHIDDSDVGKPEGYKFESLGVVRYGSDSTPTKNIYKKGYHDTQVCAITNNRHPVKEVDLTPLSRLDYSLSKKNRLIPF